MKNLLLKNGFLYDPLNNILGEREDLCIVDGLISEGIRGEIKEIDCRDMVLMPSGVDIHTHFAGSAVNKARMMRPESFRGKKTPVPTTRDAGRNYSVMGYTHLNEPAVAPLNALHMHHEFNHTPNVDKTSLLLVGNNHQIMEYISEGEEEKTSAWLAYMISKTKTYGLKAVNPGGYIAWERGGNIESIDDLIPEYGIKPKQVIEALVRARGELKLPHPVHLHLNNIGRPGSWEAARETLALNLEMHVTHLQFSCYGGEGWGDMNSRAADLANEINQRDRVTVDVGQIIFGDTTTLTADSGFEHYLGELTHGRWCNMDIENEAGGGVVPYNYRRKNHVNAIQWACGLELALLVENPWQISLSTDHPNAGSFMDYPKIIAWLMDRKYRGRELGRCHKSAREKTTLESLDRELSLGEIAVLTRAGPAKRLGLDKSLAVGARADLAVYKLNPEESRGDVVEKAFRQAEYTLKNGVIVSRKGVVRDMDGETLYVNPPLIEDLRDDIKKRFMYYSINEANYGVGLEHIKRPREVKT